MMIRATGIGTVIVRCANCPPAREQAGSGGRLCRRTAHRAFAPSRATRLSWALVILVMRARPPLRPIRWRKRRLTRICKASVNTIRALVLGPSTLDFLALLDVLDHQQFDRQRPYEWPHRFRGQTPLL